MSVDEVSYGTRSPSDWQAAPEREYARLQSELAAECGVGIDTRVTSVDEVGEIHYLTAGDPDGDPVLLLHGLSTTAATWLPLVPALSEHHVIAPDRPGRGLSAAPTFRGRDLRAYMTAYLPAVLDAEGVDRARVAGNSLGGLQAFLLALDHGRVERLCLVGAPGGVGGRMPLSYRLLTVGGVNRVLTWLNSRGDPVKNARQETSRVAVVDDSAVPEAFYAVLGAGVELPGRRESLLSFVTRAGSLLGMHPMYDLTDELADIEVPTCFVWGEEDWVHGPATGRPVAERMPEAEFHSLPEHGHMPWLEPDDAADRLVREFLAA